MHSKDYRDILGGLVLILVGAAATFHSVTSLRLGTLPHLGPGGFPAALGVLLVVFGLLLLIPALGRPGDLPKVELVPMAAVLASTIVFATLLKPLGIVPAVIAMTIIASRADSRLSLPKALLLGVCLAAAAALIFPIGLEIRVPIVAWNW